MYDAGTHMFRHVYPGAVTDRKIRIRMYVNVCVFVFCVWVSFRPNEHVIEGR